MSDTFVLPMLFSVEDARQSSLEALTLMAEISTDVVLNYVNKYIQNNTGDVAEKLQQAFSTVNARRTYLQGDNLREMVMEVNNISLLDVNAAVPLEKLELWKEILDSIYSDDRAVGSTKTLDNDALEDCLVKLSDTKDSERVIALIENNRTLFKNAPFKRSYRTVVSSLFTKKEQYDLLLYGLNFLIGKLKSGANPINWRLL